MTQRLQPARPDRDNHFNLIRLVLASLVILSHAPELVDGDRHRELLTRAFGTLSFGELAVDGFFILSGFLICQSWANAPKFRPFLVKRVLRIFPGFIVASLVCALLVPVLVTDLGSYFGQFRWDRFSTGVALLRVPVVPTIFSKPYAGVNGSVWTIE